MLSEGQVRSAGVPSGEAPLRFTVPGQEDGLQRIARHVLSRIPDSGKELCGGFERGFNMRVPCKPAIGEEAMPFDGLEFSGHAPVHPAAHTQAVKGLRQRLSAFKLWLLWGGRSSGIEALETAVPGDAQDADVVRLLMAAVALIEPESKWIQGAYRTFGGRYCAMGALQAAGLSFNHATRIRARRLLTGVARERGFHTVERMNDTSTHAGVLSAFDTAITAAISQRLDAYVPRAA